MVTLAPSPSLVEWAATDAQWWQELAAVKTAWMQGREASRSAKENMDAYLEARKGANARR